jgi:flagellar biosynthetic protein FliP
MSARTTADRPTWRAALTDRGFVVHFLQMLAAMIIGMMLFGRLSMLFEGGVAVQALLMATWMNVGMAAWMAWKRHGVAATAEMCAAMYLSFAVVLPLSWLGLLTGHGVLMAGHVLMLPAMALAMLRRRELYLHR